MKKSVISRFFILSLPCALLWVSLPLESPAAPAPAVDSAAPKATEKRPSSSGKKAGDARKDKAAKPRGRAARKEAAAQRSAEADRKTSPAEAKAKADPPPGKGNEDAAPQRAEDDALSELRAEVERLSLERDKLIAENTIAQELVIKELTVRESETERVELEIEERELELKRDSLVLQAKLDKELAVMRAEKERFTLQHEIVKAKSDAEISKLKLLEEERKSRLSELDSQIQEKEKRMERNNYTDQEPIYLANPLEKKRLTISDRRISLNGPIYNDTADYFSERINYFNNKDRKMPIFVVIDYSPGGSVMSGYKILKAMEGSDAPVYVVVKSFAGSMAACITALADRSFAYPNALILHHQLSGITSGNLTQQKEFVEEAQEWWRRLAGPVAEKMGIELDEFIAMMYRNKSSGDWIEFANEAAKLKWVDHIIEEIRETSLVKNPDFPKSEEESPTTYTYRLEEKIDEKGEAYVQLPRLVPFDFYWIYDPQGFYRVR
ncbi:MAG: ATP-dependent Clp protease proteolytic subunit [Verrucomicrobiales bacterium]